MSFEAVTRSSFALAVSYEPLSCDSLGDLLLLHDRSEFFAYNYSPFAFAFLYFSVDIYMFNFISQVVQYIRNSAAQKPSTITVLRHILSPNFCAMNETANRIFFFVITAATAVLWSTCFIAKVGAQLRTAKFYTTTLASHRFSRSYSSFLKIENTHKEATSTCVCVRVRVHESRSRLNLVHQGRG